MCFFFYLFLFFPFQFIECCKKGANLLIQGPDHCSLLHHAAKTGNGEIVKYILEHGESQWANPRWAVLQPSVSQSKPHWKCWKWPHSSVLSLSEMSTCSMCEQEAGNGVAMRVMAADKVWKEELEWVLRRMVFSHLHQLGSCEEAVWSSSNNLWHKNPLNCFSIRAYVVESILSQFKYLQWQRARTTTAIISAVTNTLVKNLLTVF